MKELLWFVLVWMVGGYSAINSYISHTESGTVSVSITDKITLPGVILEHYAVVYKKKFVYQPKIIFGVHTFQNCPNQNRQFVHTHRYNASSITQYLFEVYITDNMYTDTNYKFVMNYFVADTASNTYLELKQGYFNAPDPTPSYHTLTFTKPGINLPQVYTKCFASSIFCHGINILPFKFQNKCTAISSTVLQLQFKTNSVSAGCSVSFPITFWAIAIHPHISAQFYHDTLLTVPPSFPKVTHNINTPSSSYFIGFTTFRATSSCLKLSLKSNNIEVDQSSSIVSIQYEYFFIKQSWISLIKSFPFSSNLQITFQQTNGFSPQIMNGIYNQSLQSVYYDSNILYSSIVSPITNYHVDMIFTMKNLLSQTFPLQFSFKLINIDHITISSKKATISIKNIEQSLQFNSLILNDSNIIIQSLDDLANQTVLINIEYLSQNIDNKYFSLGYKNIKQDSKSELIFTIPKILKIQSSSSSIWVSVIISNIPSSTTSASINWDSQNVQSSSFSKYDNNQSLQIKFQYLLTVESSMLLFNYQPNILTQFSVYFSNNLITVKSIQITRNSKQIILTFINIDEISSISAFSTDLTGLSIKSFINNNQLILQYDSPGYNKSFQLTYSSSQHQYQVCIKDLIIVQRVKSIAVDRFNHWLNFTLINLEGVTALPLITYSHPQLILNKSTIDNHEIQLSNKYNSTIHGGKLTLNYEINSSTIYYEIINIELMADENLIVYCIDPFENNRSRLEIMVNILIVIYWIIMAIGMFFCQKIYAVETMFALQFMYMSLIPIGIYCPPFDILKNLKYSFGWNGIFQTLTQTTINVNYQALGINSNFLSNVNFMVILILICPIVYIILRISGNHATHYRTKPRLLVYGKTFLLDVPFTLVLITVPNICMSFVINLQAFGTTNIISLIFSIFMFILILLTVILFCIFKSSFLQFKRQFCEKKQICKISVQKSTQIRRLYPIMILFEMIIISSILASKNLMAISIYVCFGILAFVTLIILIVAPYANTIDNVRLFIHRFLVLLLCGCQIGFLQLRHDYAQRTSFVYDYPWLPLATLMIISCVFSLPYIIYKSILWFKRRGVIDMQLYTQQTSKVLVNKRNYYPKKTTGINKTYPILQHSRFEKGIQLLLPSNIKTAIKPIIWQQMNLPPQQLT